jgi:hypothetical protein
MKELIKIQSELKAPKSLYNKFGKYNYRSAEDILEAVKPLLNELKCTLIIQEVVKEVGSYTFIESTATITNDDSQSSYGVGVAGIEKAGGMALPQAFGSASSYAKKYAMGNLFLLDDTKDADATNDYSSKPVTNNQSQSKVTAPKTDYVDPIAVLKQCKTMQELQTAYMSLNAEQRKNSEVTKVKDDMKVKLNV